MNHPNRNKRAAARGPHPTGAQIRQTREKAEQTQTEAAQSIQVALRTWQDYEGERRKMPPGLFRLYKLLTRYPSIEDLLDADEKKRASAARSIARAVHTEF